MEELIKRYLFAMLKGVWLRGIDGIQGVKPFWKTRFSPEIYEHIADGL